MSFCGVVGSSSVGCSEGEGAGFRWGSPPLAPPSKGGERVCRVEDGAGFRWDSPPLAPPSKGGERVCRVEDGAGFRWGSPPLAPPSKGGERVDDVRSLGADGGGDGCGAGFRWGSPPLAPPSKGGETGGSERSAIGATAGTCGAASGEVSSRRLRGRRPLARWACVLFPSPP